VSFWSGAKVFSKADCMGAVLVGFIAVDFVRIVELIGAEWSGL